MSEQLKPCPFCGAAAEIVPVRRDWWAIEVQHDQSCVFDADHRPTVPKTEVQKQVLINDWNRRASLAGAAEPVAYLVTGLSSGEPSLCFESERGDYGDEDSVPVFTPLVAEVEGLRNKLVTARVDALNEAAQLVPMNWLDSLMSGDFKDGSQVEALLRGLRDRILTRAADAAQSATARGGEGQ